MENRIPPISGRHLVHEVQQRAQFTRNDVKVTMQIGLKEHLNVQKSRQMVKQTDALWPVSACRLHLVQLSCYFGPSS